MEDVVIVTFTCRQGFTHTLPVHSIRLAVEHTNGLDNKVYVIYGLSGGNNSHIADVSKEVYNQVLNIIVDESYCAFDIDARIASAAGQVHK